jgi:hypothetical protein
MPSPQSAPTVAQAPAAPAPVTTGNKPQAPLKSVAPDWSTVKHTRKRCRTLADLLDGGGSFKKPMYESIVLPILDDSQTEKASSTW